MKSALIPNFSLLNFQMINEFKINGLVVSVSTAGDNNKILSILTANGTISVVAYAAKRDKSPLLATTQHFCYCEFVLKQGKGDLLYIKEAELIENFYKLRESVEKLEAATDICKFAVKNLPESVECSEILRIILNTLYLLQSKDDEKDIKNICILKILHLLGELEISSEFLQYIVDAEMNKLYSVELDKKTSNFIDKLVLDVLK